MNHFELSPVKRLISRIYFYTTILAGSYVIGNMLPSSADNQAGRDPLLGVATAYFGVPFSELPPQYREQVKW